MELPFDASKLTGTADSITLWDTKRLQSMRHSPTFQHLCSAIDAMGIGSKQSQGINAVLTSVERLRGNPDHRLYLMCCEKKCIGIIKVGVKKLFIRRSNGSLVEMEPLCVLDFFVHESEQRNGYGKVLYEFMLRTEGVEPRQLAIDRPSPKFLGFLKKHYHLCEYVPQSNNFVVFNAYFDGAHTSPPQIPAVGLSDSRRQLNPNRSQTGQIQSSFGVPLAANTVAARCPAVGASDGRSAAAVAGLVSSGDVAPRRQPQCDPLPDQHVGSRELSASCSKPALRRSSPTRSAVGYNIICPDEVAPSSSFHRFQQRHQQQR